MFDPVFFSNCQTGTEHFHHRIFVLGVDRIGSTHHHDQMNFKLEGFHSLEKVLKIFGISTWE